MQIPGGLDSERYRRKVLVGGVDVRLKEIVREAAEEWQCEIHELEVLPDQAHALRSSAIVLSIHRFVKRVNGRSSRGI